MLDVMCWICFVDPGELFHPQMNNNYLSGSTLDQHVGHVDVSQLQGPWFNPVLGLFWSLACFPIIGVGFQWFPPTSKRQANM